MKEILERRAAKYVKGGFEVCYLCGYHTPDEIHHTSYFPEECVAVCSACHGEIHSDYSDTGLEPEQKRPDDYEKQRRRAEANGEGYADSDPDNAVRKYKREQRERVREKIERRPGWELHDGGSGK